ncbi:hypothetical protein D9M69_685170 [compost metagenome]
MNEVLAAPASFFSVADAVQLAPSANEVSGNRAARTQEPNQMVRMQISMNEKIH